MLLSTLGLEDARAGGKVASEKLWHRYYEQLVRVARCKLHQNIDAFPMKRT
ncbi:MAG TPA: hypothetical protein DDW52_15045 [Planctomycetaceae bacterium]|nr:hypothetical protein [Planctomycetaceae bacterium]